MRAAIFALVLAALAAGPVHAQPADAPTMTGDARAHWQRGLAEHAARHYQAASAEFAACYQLAQRRECLFAWAQAARLAGDCETARELYRRYLQGALSPRQAEAARGQLAACEAHIAARAGGRPDPTAEPRTTSEPRAGAAQPGVDPRGALAQPGVDPRGALAQPSGEPRTTPEPRTGTAQSGVDPRGALAQPSGEPRTTPEPRTSSGQPGAVSARPIAEPGVPLPRPLADHAPASLPWYRDRWGDVLAGGGVVAVAAGAAIYASARRDAASSAPTYDAYEEHFRSAETARRWALAAIGAGAALIASGVIHMALREGPAPAAAAAAPRVDLVLDGTQLALRCAGAF